MRFLPLTVSRALPLPGSPAAVAGFMTRDNYLGGKTLTGAFKSTSTADWAPRISNGNVAFMVWASGGADVAQSWANETSKMDR